jgi:outer membrane protein TolC
VVETIQQQVQSARENYREISAQFEEGLVDSADVSDALTTLNEAELRLASARNTLRLDRLRLELAIGTFAESHLEKGPNHESP